MVGRHAEEVARVITKSREQAPPASHLQAGASLQPSLWQSKPLSNLLSSDAAVDASLAASSAACPSLDTRGLVPAHDPMGTSSLDDFLSPAAMPAATVAADAAPAHIAQEPGREDTGMPDRPASASAPAHQAQLAAVQPSVQQVSTQPTGAAKDGPSARHSSQELQAAKPTATEGPGRSPAVPDKLPGRAKAKRAGGSAMGGMFGKRPSKAPSSAISEPGSRPLSGGLRAAQQLDAVSEQSAHKSQLQPPPVAQVSSLHGTVSISPGNALQSMCVPAEITPLAEVAPAREPAASPRAIADKPSNTRSQGATSGCQHGSCLASGLIHPAETDIGVPEGAEASIVATEPNEHKSSLLAKDSRWAAHRTGDLDDTSAGLAADDGGAPAADLQHAELGRVAKIPPTGAKASESKVQAAPKPAAAVRAPRAQRSAFGAGIGARKMQVLFWTGCCLHMCPVRSAGLWWQVLGSMRLCIFELIIKHAHAHWRFVLRGVCCYGGAWQAGGTSRQRLHESGPAV